MLTTMQNDSPKSAGHLHFKNPPIIEAVIALSIAPLPESMIEKFRGFVSDMTAAGYRQPEPVTEHHIQLKIEGEGSSFDKSASPHGLKFLSEDGLHAAQFNRNAFVFSRLGQYDSWERFRDDARKLWEIYSRATGGREAINVGVRYINKLFIPVGVDPEIYVTAFPKLPDEISTPLYELFMRVGMEIAEPKGRFVHTQAILPPEREGFATLLFDNDFQFPIEGKSDAQTWEILESVRVLKDRFFVSLTTEKMRETFDA
jgi:uncharacterized protein (TIGR04255 family)